MAFWGSCWSAQCHCQLFVAWCRVLLNTDLKTTRGTTPIAVVPFAFAVVPFAFAVVLSARFQYKTTFLHTTITRGNSRPDNITTPQLLFSVSLGLQHPYQLENPLPHDCITLLCNVVLYCIFFADNKSLLKSHFLEWLLGICFKKSLFYDTCVLYAFSEMG